MTTTQLDYTWSTGSGFNVFPKLSGSETFYKWRKDMRDLFVALNQESVIDGTEPPPPARANAAGANTPTADEAKVERAWAVRQRRAYMEISLHVDDAAKETIMDLTDPKAAWDALVAQYGAVGGQAAILHTKLGTTKPDPSKPIEEHYNLMLSFKTKLGQLGANDKISDEQFKAYLLSSLPVDYDVFVSSVAPTETHAQILTRLKLIDQRKDTRGEGPSSSGTALASVRGTNSVKKPQYTSPNDKADKSKSGDSRPRGKRGKGKGKGKKDGGGDSGTRFVPTCYVCGKEHWSKDCPDRHPNSKKLDKDKPSTSFSTGKPTGRQFAAVRGTAFNASRCHGHAGSAVNLTNTRDGPQRDGATIRA